MGGMAAERETLSGMEPDEAALVLSSVYGSMLPGNERIGSAFGRDRRITSPGE